MVQNHAKLFRDPSSNTTLPTRCNNIFGPWYFKLWLINTSNSIAYTSLSSIELRLSLAPSMAPSSDLPSRTSTPRAFTSQTASAEDLLKSQTVGLVHLSDFRKRRAEVLEQQEKEAQDRSYGRFKPSSSGNATPVTIDDTAG